MDTMTTQAAMTLFAAIEILATGTEGPEDRLRSAWMRLQAVQATALPERLQERYYQGFRPLARLLPLCDETPVLGHLTDEGRPIRQPGLALAHPRTQGRQVTIQLAVIDHHRALLRSELGDNRPAGEACAIRAHTDASWCGQGCSLWRTAHIQIF